jgi:hypothetical protein
MKYPNTVQNIISHTGLSYQWITKCIKTMPEIFDTYSIRGDNNSILLDNNALVIFDQVKQLKEQGYTIANIKLELMKNLYKQEKTEDETSLNKEESATSLVLVKALENSFSELLKAKEEVIKTKDEVIESHKREVLELKNQILLITDGRSPEQIRNEQLQKEREILEKQQKLEIAVKEKDLALSHLKQKEDELKKIDLETSTKFSEKDILLKQQQEKTRLLEEEKKALEEHQNLNKQLKNELLKKLEELEGKWFVGTKRKDILKQLQELA